MQTGVVESPLRRLAWRWTAAVSQADLGSLMAIALAARPASCCQKVTASGLVHLHRLEAIRHPVLATLKACSSLIFLAVSGLLCQIGCSEEWLR